MKPNGSSVIPLYQQVLNELKTSIMRGDYQPGDKIPPEDELCKMFSVSRVTIRRSIEELAEEGYLIRRQGKGTFVNRRKLTRKIRQFSGVQSFTSLCAEEGMKAAAKVLERRVVSASVEEKHFFGSDCSELIFISRIRSADSIPIMREDNYFPHNGFEFLLTVQLENVSLFETIRKKTRRSPENYGEDVVEITMADGRMADELDICIGDPLFFENVQLSDANEVPICLSKKYLVGSRYAFCL